MIDKADKCFTMQMWGTPESTPEKWEHIAVMRKSNIINMYYQEELEGVLFMVKRVSDAKGLKEKHYIRADMVTYSK